MRLTKIAYSAPVDKTVRENLLTAMKPIQDLVGQLNEITGRMAELKPDQRSGRGDDAHAGAGHARLLRLERFSPEFSGFFGEPDCLTSTVFSDNGVCTMTLLLFGTRFLGMFLKPVNKIRLSDYSLVGKDTALAIEKGLAEATWYASPVPKQKMRELLERRDGPAIRDTLLWFALIIGSGVCGFMLWGTWWAILPFMVYGVLYASTSDSRWHEPGHGTAFKTDWMNNALYEIASFMVLRESTRWRWSHARHHSDTIIVGRDPEIAVTRPPNLLTLF